MQSLAGTTIKGYELREQIGVGGFGAVYRAYQPIIDREVAMKIILPEHANQPEFIRGFEAEAQFVARLEHPYIVPLFDFWRDPDGAFLVMRLLRGGSLAKRLRQGALSLEDTLRMVEQITAALHVAHRNGVVHRDLKPDNILLDEEGNAYLTDFGIAKLVGGGSTEQNISGSIRYIAPEQLRAEPTSTSADMYSLGLMIYEMLTGQYPFGEATITEIVMKHLEEPLPDLSEALPDAPYRLNAILQQATAKDPAQRYADVRQIAGDMRQAIQANAGLALEVLDWQAIDPAQVVNPYKGLRAFQEADSADFFGREALVERLLGRLSEDQPYARFLNVVGPSGSGKSSVVRAGLLPALRQGRLPGSDRWFIVDMLPGAQPLRSLEAALLSVALRPPSRLYEMLRADSGGLVWAVDRVLADVEGDLLLVIDQFEELFTNVEDEAERLHFLSLIQTAISDPDSRLRVVVTLRADFTDRPLEYVDFGELVRQRTEFILPLSAQEIERAISGPAQRVGLIVESELVAAIVADVREEPGALPLLQYALTEVFERREGLTLTLKAYQDSGGVLGALARRAEEVYLQLDLGQQRAARQMFLRLVTLGEGVEDTRRRARRSEIAAIVPSPQTLQSVLDAFGQFRLLTFDYESGTREPTLEVAHEALIREWKRLREWLDVSRGDVRLQRVLAGEANEWLKSGRDSSFLLSGARLAQYEEWQASTDLALTPLESDYIRASIEERQRKDAAEVERKRREEETAARAEQFAKRAAQLRRASILLGVVVVGAVLATFALIAQVATTQTEVAQGQTQIAQVEPTLAAAEGQIATAQQQVAGVQPTLQAAQDQIEAAEAQIAAVQPTLAAGETQIAGVQPTLQAANQQVAAANAQVAAVQPTVQAAQGQLREAQTQVAAVQPTVRAAQAQIDAIVPTLAFAETRVAGVEPTLAAANTQVAGVVPTLVAANAQVSEAQAQVAAVQPTVQAAQGQLSAAQTQVAGVQPTLAAGQTQVAGVQPTLAAAGAQVAAANTQVAAVQPTVQAAQAQIDAIVPTLAFAETRVAGVEPTLQAANAQVSEAQAQVAAVQPTVQAAQGQLSAAQTQVAGVQPTLAAGQTQVAGVQPTLAAADAQVAAANTQVAAVQPTVQAAQAQIDAIVPTLAFAETRVAGVEPTLAAANAQVSEAQAQVAAVQPTVRAAQAQIDAIVPTLAFAETRVAGVEPTLAAANAQVSEAQAQVAAVQPTVQAAQAQIDAIVPTLAFAETRVAGVEPTLVAANAQVSEAQAQVAAVQPTVQAAQAQIDAIVPTLAFAETRVAGVEPTLAAANRQVSEAQAQVAAVQPTVQAAQAQIDAIVPTLAFAETRVAGVEPTLQAANAQVSEAQAQVAAVQPTVQAAQAQIDAIVPTLAFAETRVAGVEPTLNAANTQVAGVEPTLAQAETQIAGVQPTLSFIQNQVVEQRQIVDALRLVRAAQQLLDTSNPDLAMALVLEAYRLNPTLGETQRILNNALPLTVRLDLRSLAPNIVGTRLDFVSILREREETLLDPDRFIATESNALQRFSPDERFLALARGSSVEIWSPTTRTRLHNLATGSPVSALAFSPDGQRLLGGLSSGQIVVWDAGTGQELRRLVGHNGAVLSIAYHPDLPRAISGSDDRRAILWNVDEGQQLGMTPAFNSAPLLAAFNANGSEAYAFDFDIDSPQVGIFRLGVTPFLRGVRPYRAISPNGATGVRGSDGRTFLELWDADNSISQREFRLGNFSDDFIRQIAFSNDNRSILVAAEKRVYLPDRSYRVNGRFIAHWDIVTGGEIRRFDVPFSEAESWEAYSLAFSPDDRLALVGARTSKTYSVLLYDVATGREVRRWKGHQAPIVRVAFSPLGTYALSTSEDGNVRVWDARSGDLNLLQQVRIPAESLGDFGLSADGARAFVSFNGRSLAAWDLRAGQELRGTRFTSGAQQQVIYNPLLPQALVRTLEQLTLYNLETTQIIHRFDDVKAVNLTALAFSADGQSVWYAEEGRLYAWDSATPRQRRLVLPPVADDPTRYDIRFIAPAPNGEYVALILGRSELTVYDLIENRFIWRNEDADRTFNSLSYSPDSGRLLTALGEPDNTLVLWDAFSGRPIYNLVGHSADVLSGAFGPDGTIALSGGLDTRLILWDLLNGQIIREYSGHTAPVRQVVFVPAGGLAYSRSDSLEDGLLAWSVQSARETVNFVYNNRYVPPIDCQQRQQYGVQPLCGADGVIPPPLPTPTSQATATATPTATPRPTQTPTNTPTPRGILQGDGGGNINIRSGAGPGFSLVTQAASGTPVEILEVITEIGWTRILLPDGQVGWVRSSLIRRTD